MNGAQTTQPTTSKPAMTQVNTDVTLGGLFVTQDSHDTHMAARTDWVNHDWGSDVRIAECVEMNGGSEAGSGSETRCCTTPKLDLT